MVGVREIKKVPNQTMHIQMKHLPGTINVSILGDASLMPQEKSPDSKNVFPITTSNALFL
ncbi:hypothetical protein PB01_10425 [Psychrobacillus glaciei]|uniref:Uncharacterized protein n=1 Tax=Psychrobacillus glaciei TaxID=2283160 RepID=A0A5J6SP04_9BACI|nr:hypothetical protein PB01_10425 [Psychrobacillus glaciei]